MTQKYKIEFEIDSVELFDMVAKMGQETAGSRFLQTFMQASTGRLSFSDHIALAVYGIAAGAVRKVEPLKDADLAEAAADEICNACKRPSIECSRNPCPAVIEDRNS